ncbi:MAG TPA: hypothetical protein VMZ71_01935, partial [Gemmataceae bacterium]|nr:hypothetical protein [Gemmataceae bacterium]
MALSKCPECGAAVTARGGATTTTCPKCNTVFDAGMAGGIDEPDAGGQNWSYKNSWQRYAVL